MIDHASVSVSDPVASKAFYEAALAPLGYRVVMEFGPVTGLGGPVPGAPEGAPVHADLWLAPAESPTPCHVAVTASSTAQVDAFHEAALAAGGADAAQQADDTGLACNEGGEGGRDDDDRHHRAHGRQQVDQGAGGGAARGVLYGVLGNRVLGGAHRRGGTGGADHIPDLTAERAHVGARFRGDVEVLVVGVGAHGRQLFPRRVQGILTLVARDDPHHLDADRGAFVVLQTQ